MSDQTTKTTAGAWASTNVPIVTPRTTVPSALAYLKEKVDGFDSITTLYVVEKGSLCGVLSMHELLRAPLSASMSEIMRKEALSLDSQSTIKELVHFILSHELKAAPVVQNGMFVGAVPADTVLHLLNEEHTNYLYKSAGIKR